MKLFGEQQYVKDVKDANKKGYTYEPELYKEKYDNQTGRVKRQKLPRLKGAVITTSDKKRSKIIIALQKLFN